MKNMKKKLTAVLLAGVLAVTAGCGSTTTSTSTAASGSESSTAETTDGKTYTIGICQLVQHTALDAATKGFTDTLTAALGDRVIFDEQNASGDSANCVTICGGFAADNVDLIMANATAALQAAVTSTNEIPVLGTSVTDYASALDISDWTGATGMNVSGTSDLAPLDQQAAMVKELFPDAKTVGIIYCSGEANSVYQFQQIKPMLEAEGYTVNEYSFADSNDVTSVTESACDCDVIYIPTDNTAASCTEAIANVVLNKKVPVVAGESGICAGCGVATLSIDYYNLGVTTGEMALEILEDGADISTMDVRFAPECTKQYNAANCKALGITVPDDYVAIDG